MLVLSMIEGVVSDSHSRTVSAISPHYNKVLSKSSWTVRLINKSDFVGCGNWKGCNVLSTAHKILKYKKSLFHLEVV